MEKDRVAARFLSALIYKKRPVGRTNYTTRHSYISDIKKIVPFIDESGSFNTWAHIANEELIWSQLVNNLGNKDFEFDFSNYFYSQNERNTPINSPESKKHKSPRSSSPFPPSPSPVTYSNNSYSKLFEVLNVLVTNILREVTTAYGKLARLYHPDH